jgi:hypothetical protein
MTTFIKADSVKTTKEKINEGRVNDFIEAFNNYIKRGRRTKRVSDNFSLNNILDDLPMINNSEFECAVKLANEAGWVLTKYSDNYQTTSFKMSKII